MDLTSLAAQLNELSKDAYPIDEWQPDRVGSMDMQIKSDGQWFHEGDLVTREKLKILFSKIMRREGRDYYLVTPVEKIKIEVDDAAFVVVDFEIEQPNSPEQIVWLYTNIGDRVPLSALYSLVLKGDEQRPYLGLWRGLDALIERNTYYQLIEHAQQVNDPSGKTSLIIHSNQQPFSLGTY